MQSALKTVAIIGLMTVTGTQLVKAQYGSQQDDNYADSLKKAIAPDFGKICDAGSYSKYTVFLGKNISQQQLKAGKIADIADRRERIAAKIEELSVNHPETTFVTEDCIGIETEGNNTTTHRWLEVSAEATINNRPVVLVRNIFPKIEM